jgi:hypothetical protein
LISALAGPALGNPAREQQHYISISAGEAWVSGRLWGKHTQCVVPWENGRNELSLLRG